MSEHVQKDYHSGTPRPGSQIERDNVEIKAGHRYEYHGVEGSMQTATGLVVKILTEPDIAGSTHKTVNASEEEPRYIVRNDHTGKETAYYKRAFERELPSSEGVDQYHHPQKAVQMETDSKSPERTTHLDRDNHRGTARSGSQIEANKIEIMKGHRYEYHAVEGSRQTASGVVLEIITQPEDVDGRTVQASEDEPRYLVQNDNTGKTTAYYKRVFEREIVSDADSREQ